ncbi:bifunctional demethylmenaquinone methyltransferase/2-methoxy-6-polyprenyl-1,4-benzoquinol methylase UbiE [Nitrosomonas sp. JL21]|uniref:bifunctional demethylmenaquinone methyltransferase/2-methoxy-6-polyprenyl-1,4-benzoquinol methylase UbiE n=1 Tax=Nitrosomonas sp. JL21 TaxID=153949 RepID=UPI00136D362D|nr:bifunctional demethylmenaquinone methyltransferase/2-methoxy-6-polyprenyl-1,4-benzoquinol methylase UbiE [Nitrosomonas sp. JL21]MBL8497823.1 bifunctional demethylmenaquinone methyltransferase/2-methoxy-6-polyprenyl-1,4-benzoquinol methylase UbiE [Nitrosomonas sp.]MCC7092402.1 bifunctional demethylmenaquinone methyltransferase/2-methoxy-6-polyprenyl-1,4-benzoquinol methylase UbiE [Nitrosomonas sp.]MXS76769.1 bifunctional demethylmenaquinone methyltransferase/2-methoxy-6-polyprenyl-1,4-benzoqui
MTKTTHFGFNTVAEEEKAGKVADVFHSVAERYNLMNDLMSVGLHRLWKRFTIEVSGVKKGDKVLDIAGGTGDLSALFIQKVGNSGEVWLTDINNSMLSIGRDRLIDEGTPTPAAQCDAEKLPYPDNYFNCVSVAFGLRNMTHKDAALKEMLRVIKPGGTVIVLEFSKIWGPLRHAYDTYSFKLLPVMGKVFASDAESYRYLAESIRMHPSQEELKELMQQVGFDRVEYFNMTAGIVALHRGYKF